MAFIDIFHRQMLAWRDLTCLYSPPAVMPNLAREILRARTRRSRRTQSDLPSPKGVTDPRRGNLERCR